MPSPTRPVRLAALALVGATVAGCGSPGDTHLRAARPVSSRECNDLPTHRGDGYVLAGSDWSDDTHKYGETAIIYACVHAPAGGRVRFVVDGSGISVSPSSRRVDRSGTGVVPFRVRVSPGASGALSMTQRSGGGSAGGPGPRVVATSEGWQFTSPG